MVGHDHESVQLVVVEAWPPLDGIHYDLGDGWLTQKQGTIARAVQLAVHPGKSLPGEQFCWRVHRVRQTAVQVPRDKQICPAGMEVGQAAAVEAHNREVQAESGASHPQTGHRQDCRCGTHGCVRHKKPLGQPLGGKKKGPGVTTDAWTLVVPKSSGS
jgi:hypothetical protein